jgi:hypothetical protein
MRLYAPCYFYVLTTFMWQTLIYLLRRMVSKCFHNFLLSGQPKTVSRHDLRKVYISSCVWTSRSRVRTRLTESSEFFMCPEARSRVQTELTESLFFYLCLDRWFPCPVRCYRKLAFFIVFGHGINLSGCRRLEICSWLVLGFIKPI